MLAIVCSFFTPWAISPNMHHCTGDLEPRVFVKLGSTQYGFGVALYCHHESKNSIAGLSAKEPGTLFWWHWANPLLGALVSSAAEQEGKTCTRQQCMRTCRYKHVRPQTYTSIAPVMRELPGEVSPGKLPSSRPQWWSRGAASGGEGEPQKERRVALRVLRRDRSLRSSWVQL